MPNNGRIVEWKSLEFKCASSGSYSGSGDGIPTYGHSAQASTAWAPNAVDLNTGIALSCESNFDGVNGDWQVTYDGPGAPFGGYVVGGSVYLSSVSIQAIARNVKLYCKLTGSLWRLVWDQVDIFINGVFDITLPGSAIDLTSNGTGPNYVPLIGIPMTLTGGVSGGRTNVRTWSYDPCNPGAGLPIQWSAEMTGGPSGGWRFQELDDTWVDLPCMTYQSEPSSGTGCPFGLNIGTVVSAGTTYGASINCRSFSDYKFEYVNRQTCQTRVIVSCGGAEGGGGTTVVFDQVGPSECTDPCTGLAAPHYQDIYKTTTNSESQGGSVRLVPNLERAIRRMSDTYRALWYRGTFPQVTALLARSCVDGAVTVSTSSTPEVYPSVSEFLACVGSDPHVIEEPFDRPVYCPTTASKNKNRSESFSAYPLISTCLCPPSWVGDWTSLCAGIGVASISCDLVCPSLSNINKSESVSCAFPHSVGAGGGYQSHTVPLARYTGSWPNPHWQYFYWREDWDVDGSAVPWADYWGPIREQWNYHPALPPSEQRRTRNSMILSPVENDQGNTPFLDATVSGLRWIGAHRWKTQDISLPTSLTLSTTRPGQWNPKQTGGIDDCSISLGPTGVTCSGFTVSTPSVDLQIGSWSQNPYMLLYLANRVAVSWGTNVNSMTLSLIGIDGVSKVLGTTEQTYDITAGLQDYYAGSWGIDNGNGSVTDLGTDLIASKGLSLATMSDPERSAAFQLGRGRSFTVLRFTFEPVDPNLPVVIEWPEFFFPTDPPYTLWENSKCSCLLWENGPGVRRGQWTFFDPILGFLYPPVLTGLGATSTIIDWLCWRRVFIEGVHPLTGGTPDLTTELTQLYDTYEGQSIAVVDKFGLGPQLPEGSDNKIRAALVNSFSEVPPMACFPFRQRNTSNWLATGNPAQIVWDHCEENRYLVSPSSSQGVLKDDLQNPVGSVKTGVPNGWYAWQYSPALDNDETGWKVWIGSTPYATVRPWHGYFWINNYRSTTTGGLHLCRQPIGLMYAVESQDDGINLIKFDIGLQMDVVIPVLESQTGIGRAQIGYNPRGYLTVVFEQNGTVKYIESWSLGHNSNWSNPVNIASGTNPAYAVDEKYAIEYVAVYDTDRWKLHRRFYEQSWEYVADIVTTPTDESSAGLEVSPDGSNTLVFIYKDGSSTKRKYSLNQGKTWNDL